MAELRTPWFHTFIGKRHRLEKRYGCDCEKWIGFLQSMFLMVRALRNFMSILHLASKKFQKLYYFLKLYVYFACPPKYFKNSLILHRGPEEIFFFFFFENGKKFFFITLPPKQKKRHTFFCGHLFLLFLFLFCVQLFLWLFWWWGLLLH